MKKIVGIALIVIGIVVFIRSVQSFFVVGEREVSERIANYDTIRLSGTAIDWNIETYDGDEIVVELKNEGRRAQIVKKERGRELIIEVQEKSFRFFDFSFWGSPIVHVRFPERDLEKFHFSTVAGDVEMSGTVKAEDAFFKTVSGNLRLTSVGSRQVTVESVSGDIIIDALQTEKATFKNTSGDLYVKNFSGKLEATSISGDVDVEFADENEDVRIATTSGDISLRIPSPNAEVTLKTASGDFLIDMPIDEQAMEKRSVSGKIGAGSYSLNVTTTSGDIRLR